MKTLFKAVLLALVVGLLPVTPISAKENADGTAATNATTETSIDESVEEMPEETANEDTPYISYRTYKRLLEASEKVLGSVGITLRNQKSGTTYASAAPAPAEKKKNAVEVTAEEKEMLYRITEAEAGEGTIEQKKNVVSCVLARVASSGFPNSIEAVIFEKDQFTPVWDGWYDKVKVTDETRQAVDEVLESGRLHDYLFFCSYGCKSSYFAKKDLVEEPYMDGLHRYYTK